MPRAKKTVDEQLAPIEGIDLGALLSAVESDEPLPPYDVVLARLRRRCDAVVGIETKIVDVRQLIEDYQGELVRLRGLLTTERSILNEIRNGSWEHLV